MNVVFAGYRAWSYNIVKTLLETENKAWQIKTILTTKDAESPFHNLNTNCLTLDPQNVNTQEFLTTLAEIKPDALLFFGWSWIIPKEVYTKYLCLILHPSPLPKYRGGSPLQHQIINGETTSAVTILEAGEKIDAGDIYAQNPILLEGTLDDVFKRIVDVGTDATINVLDGIASKTITPTTQDETEATVFKRRLPTESELTIEDLQTKTSTELYNFIRALSHPYPNAFIQCKDGKKLYFTDAQIDKE